jgi:hypothetical protein
MVIECSKIPATCDLLHASLYRVVNDVHKLHPMLLVLFRHSAVTFVQNVVEGLFEEIKVATVSLLLSNQKVSVCSSKRHHVRGAS